MAQRYCLEQDGLQRINLGHHLYQNHGYGSWNYWYPFISERAWYETDDIPMPEMLQFMADIFNEGERYEKLPRFIPYAALPISMATLTARFAQAAYKIITGDLDRLIASHEAEEDLDSLKAQVQED